MSEEDKKRRREVIVKLIPSNKTRPQATAEGHIFNFNNKTRDLLTTYYTCVSFRKGCRAKLIVKTNQEGLIIKSILSGFHLQPQCQPNYAKVEATVAVENAKKLAMERPDLPTSQIMATLEQLVNDNEHVQLALPPTIYISRKINRAKAKSKNNHHKKQDHFYYNQHEQYFESDQENQQEKNTKIFRDSQNSQINQRTEMRVILSRVNCLVDSDSVNVSCDRCSTKFTSLNAFLSHLKSESNSWTNNTNKKNITSDKENEEMRIKSGQNQELKETENKYSNKEISTAASGKLMKKTKKSEEDTMWICHECGLSLPTFHRLKSHLICHSNDFPYSCSFPNCSRVFKRQWQWKNHEASHHSIRPFLCSECGSSFRTNSHLNVHMRIHREKTKKCGECSLVFHRQTSLKNHIRSVHRKETPWVCPREDCSSTFKHRSSWRYHIMWHNGDTPRTCREIGCDFQCIRPIELTRHYRKTHAKTRETENIQQEFEKRKLKQEEEEEEKEDEEETTRFQNSNQYEEKTHAENNCYPFHSQSFSTLNFDGQGS